MSSKVKKSFVETDVDILHQVSKSVDLNDVSLTSALEHKLLQTFLSLGRKVKRLAGVQVGFPYRVILLRYDIDKDPIIAFNPEVIKAIGRKKSNEGCESEGNVRYIVERPLLAKIRYSTKYKEEITEWISFSKARVFCHEVDHLDGILLQDKGVLVEG